MDRLKGRLVAVTGATGFLGGALVERLLVGGARVRAVVRSPDKARDLARRGVEIAKADLLDRPSLAAALGGADLVIANAALYVLEPRPWDEFYAANVTGAENLCDAANDAGVRRIVHVSTCGVYRTPPSVLWRELDESAPRWTAADRGWTWAYQVTKSLGEDVFHERAARYGSALTVVRPAGIFGPGDTQLVPKMAALARWPGVVLPELGFPMSYVEDVADGVLAAAARDAAIGQVYNLAGPPVNLADWMRAWRKVTGRGPRLLAIPSPFQIRFSWAKAARELDFDNRGLEEAIYESLP